MGELLGMNITDISFMTLFVWLLFTVMRTNDAREAKYQKTIDDLSTALVIVNEIKEDIKELKNQK